MRPPQPLRTTSLRGAAWLVLVLLVATSSSAQADGDLAAASTAFRQAQALQLRGDNEAAADAFLLADSIAPAPQALRGAITNLISARQTARAATLVLEAQRRYPDDHATERLAKRVLSDAAPTLLRVAVSCSAPCTVSLPGRAIFSDPRKQVDFFVEPAIHELEVRFSTGTVSERIEGAAGNRVERQVQAPEAEAYDQPVFEPTAQPVPEARPVPVVEAKPATAPVTSGQGLSPAYFWSGVGVTTAFGGVAVWSGLSTVSRNDDYESEPTKGKYEKAQARQNLTNGMIGATAASALVTGVLAYFTFRRGDRAPSTERRAQAGVWIDGQSAHLTVTGTLPTW